MKAVFAVEVQKEYNLSGVGQQKKKAFENLRFFKLLQGKLHEHSKVINQIFLHALSQCVLGFKTEHGCAFTTGYCVTPMS